MSHEPLVYSVNLAIAVILAALLTQYWLRAGRASDLRSWAIGAWVMALADLFFALRPQLPYATGRFVPTVLVTAGMAVLFVASERTAGRRADVRIAVSLTVLHAAALAAFLAFNAESGWRTVTNGVVWALLSFGAFWRLRQNAEIRDALTVTASVFLAHGLFHVGRLLMAVFALSNPAGRTAIWLQVAGDVEVSLFMVALFVSLLAGHLSLRNDELRAALGEVKELSGLLPMCAWCHKIRDGEGYWQQVERFFASRTKVQYTHSICEACLETHFGPDGSDAEVGGPTATGT